MVQVSFDSMKDAHVCQVNIGTLVLLLSVFAPAQGGLPPLTCDGQHVCRETTTNQALMVLPRSFSHIYADPGFSVIAEDSVRPFLPLYVFAREGTNIIDASGAAQGRYLVAHTERGSPAGWMRAVDVLEWRQALTVAFTHPGSREEARQPVLMFRRLEELDALLQSGKPELQALAIYEQIAAGSVPERVLSKEPEAFVDITRNFYLLPVVDHRLRDLSGDDLRLVRLASAIPGDRAAGDKPDVLSNDAYRRIEKTVAPDPARIRNMGVDLVFVMDMTLSMQPYIDRTKAAMKSIALRIVEAGLEERIRFGLVGFRDDIRRAPDLEFTSRNFTPKLVDVHGFIQLLDKQARAARVSSPGYSEDVFAGIQTGLDSDWRDNSLRFMVLVGDASGHPPRHSQSTTGKNAEVLRMAAQDLNVHIMALHLRNPRHIGDHPVAEAQFSRLSQVRGESVSALVPVQTEQLEDFQEAVRRINSRIDESLRVVQIQGSGALDTLDAVAVADDSVAGQADSAMQKIMRTAMVEYLGRDAKPPRDLLVWAADRDLTNPVNRALEVRVLLTREQLSDLILALDRILAAMLEAKKGQMDFFDSLQSLAAQTMKRPKDIARADDLLRLGLAPGFIEGLPYRSEVLSLDQDSYASLTAEQRSGLFDRLTAKLNQYREINETVDGWADLSPQGGDGSRLYPLQLDYLP